MNGNAKLKLVGLDSNVFIYHFENNPDFIPYTTTLFNKLSKGTLRAITSIVSIIEALSYPAPPAVIRDINEAFAKISNLDILDVNYQISQEAARIRRDYKFRLPDSVQLATALVGKTQAFVTNDQRLKKFGQLPVIPLSSFKS